jgi:hypothetical protein
MQISHTHYRDPLQQAEQTPDSPVRIECDPLVEVHQKRLIASGLESRPGGHGCGHFAKII